MTTYSDTHAATLEVITDLRDGAIRASIEELREHDRLTMALRSALRAGVSINDLSNASGLPCDEIRRRVERQLHLGEDLELLTGAC